MALLISKLMWLRLKNYSLPSANCAKSRPFPWLLSTAHCWIGLTTFLSELLCRHSPPCGTSINDIKQIIWTPLVSVPLTQPISTTSSHFGQPPPPSRAWRHLRMVPCFHCGQWRGERRKEVLFGPSEKLLPATITENKERKKGPRQGGTLTERDVEVLWVIEFPGLGYWTFRTELFISLSTCWHRFGLIVSSTFVGSR